MEYVYGALLLHAAGQEVSEDNLKKVLTAAGFKADETRIKALTAALDGVNIEEAISSAAFAPVAAAPTPAAGAAAPAKEEKKEEKKEERVSEEEAAAGLGALFG